MAFQSNTQPPDMVSLALNLMQMRRQQELEDRKLSLQEAQLREDSRRAAIQDHWDSIRNSLEAQRAGLEVDALKEKSGQAATAKIADPLSIVLDPTATQPEQSMAAQSYLPQLMDRAKALDPTGGSDLGRYLNQAGIDAGGMVASGMATDRRASQVKDADAARQDALNAKSDARTERYRIAAEARAQKVADMKQEAADRAAAADGVYDPKGIQTLAQANHTELAPSYDNEKIWEAFPKLNPNDKKDIYKMVKFTEKSMDPTAVREGEVAMWFAMGVDNAGAFAQRLQKIITGNLAFPEGFGKAMQQQLRAQLEASDAKTKLLIDSQKDYIAKNIPDPVKARAAFRDSLLEEKINKRMGVTGPAASDPNETDVKKAVSAISKARRIPKSQVTTDDVINYLDPTMGRPQ